MRWLLRQDSRIDWILFFSLLPLLIFGLVTMSSFTSESYFFYRQVTWILLSLAIFFGFSLVDWRFLRRSGILVGGYLFLVGLLLLLFVIGTVTKGAQSWLSLGGFSLQPADFMKLVLVLMLAKYFSKRHIEIANIRHIIVSGVYAFLPFVAIMLQPDFGSALIIFMIWLGMILVSGVSRKHLAWLGLVAIIFSVGAWMFVLQDYQKARIMTFIHPLADVRGSGYNALQSTIAVGSGQLTGKGVGYGTQSRLKFLPEYQTDFIFAAFAEEWGFFGVLIFFFLFGLIIWRILAIAMKGATNFEILFGLGIAVMFMAHLIVHVGMNIGIMPVTGLPLPFLSYGGSHLLTEFMGLGILMGMRSYSLAYHRDDVKNEFIGPQ
ncbi:MAG TPA: rod shape-determining protein RodA, partial [Candidatus Paceibacterota bacterium]|jgi:rod shape determining protein RodA|nr:rod shape-determining protein RodA [Candidatus Paceibacterota bacterium]HOH11325.1 rod shape-determining protein RodA [Candidatus Paceibacterota bacterium]HPB60296.1 rod shape-determining protein RodA [Candidatus Paceibacterota bacterium]HPV33704.1 rod shape-determining protein RodA [Candidatus Paceibacterota bacterium]HPY13100.1 rod shape-determining protein RodA [Candidatus Paceibacterota bacterium]